MTTEEYFAQTPMRRFIEACRITREDRFENGHSKRWKRAFVLGRLDFMEKFRNK